MTTKTLSLVVEDGFIKYCHGGQVCIHNGSFTASCSQCERMLKYAGAVQAPLPPHQFVPGQVVNDRYTCAVAGCGLPWSDTSHGASGATFTRPAATGGANTEWTSADGRLTLSGPGGDGDDEPVVHPKHYNSHPSGVECWDITQYYNFNVGTVIKHLWRHGLKDTTPEGTLEDLEKAQQYLKKEIDRQSELINETFTRKPHCVRCDDTGFVQDEHGREPCSHGNTVYRADPVEPPGRDPRTRVREVHHGYCVVNPSRWLSPQEVRFVEANEPGAYRCTRTVEYEIVGEPMQEGNRS